MMTRIGWTVFTLVCGLALAAAVHIVAVLLIPSFIDNAPLSAAMREAPLHQTTLEPAPSPAAPGLPFLDPATAISICPYDVSRQPVRVKASVGDEPLSLSFHALDGRVFYALSDRAAQRGVIDLVLLTRAQLDEALSLEDEEDAPQEVRLLSPVSRGYVIARVLALQPGDMPAARVLASGLSCAPDSGAAGK